jgi:hypothetical protein
MSDVLDQIRQITLLSEREEERREGEVEDML